MHRDRPIFGAKILSVKWYCTGPAPVFYGTDIDASYCIRKLKEPSSLEYNEARADQEMVLFELEYSKFQQILKAQRDSAKLN